jgi:hypothetical protein
MKRVVLFLVLTITSLAYVAWFAVASGEVRWPMAAATVLLALRTWGLWRHEKAPKA